MRHGRAKATRRTLKFYSLNSNGTIRTPYSVLCDGTFLAASVRQKVPLCDRISKILQGEKFALYVCRSALDELKKLADAHGDGDGDEGEGSVFRDARQFGLDECEIIEEGEIPPTQGKGEEQEAELGAGEGVVRLASTVAATRGGERTPNSRGFIVGTQDEDLSDILRSLPLVPQMRLSRGVLFLESQSSASMRYAAGMERRKERSGGGSMSKGEAETVKAVREEDRVKRAEDRRIKAAAELRKSGMERRKTKARGANPLSCKKRKAVEVKGPPAEKKKRRRKKKVAASNDVKD